MQAFEVSGQWWIPNYKLSTGGTLYFSPKEGIRLDLIGSVSTEHYPDAYIGSSAPLIYPIILGITPAGKSVTLVNCTIQSTKISSGGYPAQILRPGLALIGRHFTSLSEIHADKAIVEYSYLPEWYGRSGFKWNWPSTEVSENDAIVLTYTHPNEALATIAEDTITIEPAVMAKIAQFNPSITQTVSIRLRVTRSIGFIEWLDVFILPLQNFLTLATYRPNSVTAFKIIIIETEEGSENKETRVDALFEPIFYEDKTTDINLPDMLFALEDLQNFEETMKRWFETWGKLRPALNLFFGAQYRPSNYTDTAFLQTIQTIETYYHHSSTDVKGANRKNNSLRAALNALFDATEDVMLPLVHNKNRFITNVIKSRNYYIHYADELRAEAAQGHKLFWLNEALLIMLRRAILQELGFSSEHCIRLFQRNKAYTAAQSFGEFS